MKRLLRNVDGSGRSRATELWGVGAADVAGAGVVASGTVYIVLGLNHMFALRQTVVVEVRGAIARCAVVTLVIAATSPMVAALLVYRLQTGSTLVDDLNKVIVTVGNDGDSDGNTVTHLEI